MGALRFCTEPQIRARRPDKAPTGADRIRIGDAWTRGPAYTNGSGATKSSSTWTGNSTYGLLGALYRVRGTVPPLNRALVESSTANAELLCWAMSFPRSGLETPEERRRARRPNDTAPAPA